MQIKHIKDSLLYYSLKDVLYNDNTTYVYCNFNVDSIDRVLKEMLNTKVIDKDGIYQPFSKIEWNRVENYFMFNTYEIEHTLQFIKENLTNRELVICIEVDNDINTVLTNNLIELLFFEVDNVTILFKDKDTEA